jgi:nucleoside-diphosphate-sugar epimerase
MKVLFIGGTGIISSAVSELVVNRGYELYLLNRGKRKEYIPERAKLLIGNINNPDMVADIIKDMDFDVVVDWIAYKKAEVERDYKLFRDKTKQYVFISSASTYQKPLLNYNVDESTPQNNPYWDYSRDKIECEEYLREIYRTEGFPITIIRPSYTYNKTTIPFIYNSRHHRWTIVDRMKRGKKVIVPGDGTSLFSITHNTDFAKGFVGLIGNAQATGHAFHITTDEVMTWDQFLILIGEAAGYKPDIIHIPSDDIVKFDPENRGSLLGDKSVSIVFDNSKIKKYVPWYNATKSFRRGIQESIDWYKLNPELQTVDDDFNDLCDRIISSFIK